MKVLTVLGTRPEVIRLSRTIALLDRHCDHILVHTGQNYDYELNEVFFDDLRVRKPDHFLEAAGKSAAETVGLVISRIDDVLAATKPDACLILGDTNSSLAAYAAKRRKVPIFHMEAGNRCFDQRVPEEINRKVVDHLADINLTYSAIARDYLLREGIAPDRVIKTGSPMLEVLTHHQADIERSNVLTRLGLQKGDYIVASLHREENVDDADCLAAIVRILDEITIRFRKKLVFSVHPRTRKRMDGFGLRCSENVTMLSPLGFFDYVHLQSNAMVVLSDSGTITEESSILGFPAVNMRESHERPEGMEEAAVIMAGLDLEQVILAIQVSLDLQRNGPARRIVDDYNVENVSAKVLKIILSYVAYVNRVVWQREHTL